MTNIDDILSNISHRPFEIPNRQWQYYQEWNKVLFFHWTIPFDILRKYAPENLNIDTFDGKCYVSLVAFTMEKIRPGFLPAVGLISNFDEINLRTYIENDNKKGVYFLNIEAGKTLSTFIAKSISRLPYEKSNIIRTESTYYSENIKRGFNLHTEFEIKNELHHKTELDKWLTERYCLYLDIDKKSYRYDIHHKEWDLKSVEIKMLDLSYKIGGLNLTNKQPNLSHYSDGVKVIAWKRTRI